LIIGEAKWAATDLLTNAILFGKVIDGGLLVLIEPARKTGNNE
jgi:hypothetical protein